MKKWFKFYVGNCPVCFADKSYKVLQKNTPKPKERSKRFVYLTDTETYDWCCQ